MMGKGPLESGWLPPGQSLGVGPFRVRVTFEGVSSSRGQESEPPNPLLSRSSKVPGLPKVSLEFQSKTAGHSVWRMSQVVALVGSSSRCKVRLLDSNVSKLHCALIRTAKGLWVVDLLSREGIMVNSLSVRSARLRPTDVLGLGHVLVRANFEDSTTGPGPYPASSSGMSAGFPESLSFGAGLPERQSPLPWGTTRLGPASGPIFPTPVFAGEAPPASVPAPVPASQEPALSMLLGHFGQMQQQMLDQFQQSMFMMLQMFSGMHREQMGVMREELDRLRELSEEMATIKAELAKRQTRVPLPVPPPTASGRSVNGNHPSRESSPPPQSAPADSEPRTRHAPPQEPAEEVNTAPPMEPSADVHDWLNDRLSAITTEQQNRWQKLMGVLRGDK